MRKIIYSVFTVAFALMLLNNARGPVVAQQRGYTGAPGDQSGTCANCHNTGTFSSTATIQVFDSLGTTAVTKYDLGKQYTIRLTITASQGTPSAYGFQMIDIRRSDSTNVKGFLAKDKQAADIGIDTIAATNRIYAEHNARLTSNIVNVKWKAPATDIGTVVFYGVGNAVNASSSTAGDNGTPSSNVQLLSPRTAGVNELAEKVSMYLSPNPTPSDVVIKLDSKEAKNLGLRVSDISGRTVISDTWQIQRGDNQKTLNLSQLAKGAYMIQITENQNIVSKKIIKL